MRFGPSERNDEWNYDKEIVHRDIKPPNSMLTNVELVDCQSECLCKQSFSAAKISVLDYLSIVSAFPISNPSGSIAPGLEYYAWKSRLLTAATLSLSDAWLS